MPNDVNVDTYGETYAEYSGKTSSFETKCAVFADNAAFEAARSAWALAVAGATLGVKRSSRQTLTVQGSPANPSNQGAQRGVKLQLFYRDIATEEKFTLTIPTYNPDVYPLVPNTDEIDLTDATFISSFKDPFEAFVRGNSQVSPVLLYRARYVNRNV